MTPEPELPLVLLVPEQKLRPTDRDAIRRQQFVVRGVSVELKPPVQWSMDPVDNLAWRFWLHTMQFLDVPLRLYETKADLEALRIARDLVLDWIEGNRTESSRAGDYAWFDMSVGLRAAFLGYTWRECRRNHLMDRDQEEILAASLAQHGDWLADDLNYTSQTNHGLYQDAGLFLLASYATDLDHADSWRSHASERFLCTLRKHIEFAEGVHKEHSPGYQMAIRELLARLHAQTGIGGSLIAGLISKLDLAAGWMVLPDGRLLPFGDTLSGPAAEFATPSMAQQGLAAFLQSGYTFVRRDDSYLAVTCCYHTYAHKHADELSWCLHERGLLIVGEAGRHGHRDEQDPKRIYARSSQGHNTLILDDHSFDWIDEHPYGGGLLAAGEGDGWYAVLGENPLLKNAEHRRLFLYRPGQCVVVVDDIHASKRHTVLRRLHFGPALVAHQIGSQIVAQADGMDVARLTDWSRADVDTCLARGQKQPNLDGWMFPSDDISLEVSVVSLRAQMTAGVLIHSVELYPFQLRQARAAVNGDRFLLDLTLDGSESQIHIHHMVDELAIDVRPGIGNG